MYGGIKMRHIDERKVIMSDVDIPRVAVIHRTDFPEGWKFYCVFCKRYHNHGSGLGYRMAHCHNDKSPYEETGYILVDLTQDKWWEEYENE